MIGAWFVRILLCLMMYVSLDGYDLGIGVATPLERDGRARGEMLELVGEAWDGNESWLVLLAVSLWAGFPLAFGSILPHAYLPVIVMFVVPRFATYAWRGLAQVGTADRSGSGPARPWTAQVAC
jgi:cytochrome bd-type quinol oxidase subunit 2